MKIGTPPTERARDDDGVLWLGDYPVNVISRRNDASVVIDECVICGDTHRHGANEDFIYPSHRGAHCTPDGRDVGGYWVVSDEYIGKLAGLAGTVTPLDYDDDEAEGEA